MRFLPGFQPTADAHAARSSVRIAYNLRHYDHGGARIFSEMPANAATNHLLIGLRTGAQPRIDFDQRFRQPLALTLKHRAFLFGPRSTAAQNKPFAGLTAGVQTRPMLTCLLPLR